MSRPRYTETPKRRAGCRQPNSCYSRALKRTGNARPERGELWKCRTMDAEENRKQVFLRAHSPWKSQTTRFPHSHSLGEARKRGKRTPRFPLSPLLFTYPKPKGALAVASLPTSGSFFNEKMLLGPPATLLNLYI